MQRGNSLTSWSCAIREKQRGMHLLKNFPALYGTWSFMIVSTRTHHWYLSSARTNQFIPPHSISSRTILILSTHPRFGLIPSGFPTKNLHISLQHPSQYFHHLYLDFPIGLFPCDFPTNRQPSVSHSLYIPAHKPHWFDHPKQYKLWSSSLCSFLQPPVISSLFGPIFSSVLCSKTHQFTSLP
jgi:hypothetical protein